MDEYTPEYIEDEEPWEEPQEEIFPEPEPGSRHYIRTDERGRILDAWSDGPFPERDAEDAICIEENGGYQFCLFPGGEENPQMFTEDDVPLYAWDGVQVVERLQEEIESDRAALPEITPPPTEQERLRADVDFLAAMANIQL